MSARIPDWVLERHLAGEQVDGYPPAAITADPEAMRRLERLRAENAELLAALPARDVVREVQRRHRTGGPPASRTKFGWTPWVSLAVAATLVVLIAPRVGGDVPATDTERPKGLAPHLELFRKAGELTEALSPDEDVLAGDVLQLRIIGVDARYAAVVSLDGAGAVTLHAPAAPGSAIALPQGGVQVLDRAYALDDAPQFERFILVTSASPFDAALVVEAARAVGADPSTSLPLPQGLQQSSFVVRKEGSR